MKAQENTASSAAKLQMKGSITMNTYNVSYKRNDVYQSNLYKSNSIEEIKDSIAAYRPEIEVINIRLATSDDIKPGKPMIHTGKEVW